MHTLYLFQVDHTLLFQEVRQIPQREQMPFNGFLTMVLTSVVEDILFNTYTKRPLWTPRSSLTG